MKKILPIVFLLILLFSCKEDEEVPVVATELRLDKIRLELKVGETYQFKLSHSPIEAKEPVCTWSVSRYKPVGESEEYDIATIDQNGFFTAKGKGVTIVSAVATDAFIPTTTRPLQAACEVTILPIEATSVTLNKTEAVLKVGETMSLTAKVEPENVTDATIEWKSDNPQIVTVRKDEVFYRKAVVTALGEGEAVITAFVKEDSSVYTTCKIKVEPIKLEGLALSETEKTVKPGESFTLIPIFTPENASNKKVIWTSSNQSIATVDQEGKVSTHSFGECLIKAISEDGGFEAICKVIVLEPTIEEAIKVNIYGSYTSFNGFVTGDITAAFYNNSSKTVEVTDFTVYDTRTNKIIFQQENCGLAEKEKPIRYNLKFSGVYKPLFLWHYHHSGKSYTCEYRM